LRKPPHSDRYDYGFLPPRFFNRVIEAFVPSSTGIAPAGAASRRANEQVQCRSHDMT
jgi:hypothetical protein